jgi:Fur family transcriptional regulator, ferric uptake regulator
MSMQCDHRDQLTQKGIAPTEHRRLVYEIILKSSKALSAKAILKRVYHTSQMDRVTLYRILNLFTAKNIVKKIAPFNGAVCYEHVCDEHRPAHPHLICRRCGALECLDHMDVKRIKQHYFKNRLSGYEDIDIKLEGICGKCAG